MPALPMWPPVSFAAAKPIALVATAIRERWIIVDGSVRREVSERDFRGALGTCARIEVARYPHDDVVTHICYR
ncbi:MAG: hypothetical protein NVSMB64_32370 [Candidatus Velthaea sp.]